MNDEIIPYYIGYDRTEDAAYQVCRWSMARRSSLPVHSIKMDQNALRQNGLYRRAPEVNSMVDSADGKPFSTEFSFTRFLVPALTQYSGWALFTDCDFLWLGDVGELWKLRDERYAVQVVKHNYQPTETTKMQGQAQQRYPRKNWSSLILWNCGHPAHKRLTVDQVNLEPGSWLHGFGWLEDDQIGEVPERWNYLEGHSKGDDIRALHYTRGGPWFSQCMSVDYADLWLKEERDMRLQKAVEVAAE